jgi:hypothetical protein
MVKKINVKRLEGSPYALDQEVIGRGASASIVRAYNLDNLEEQLVSKIIPISDEDNNGTYKT